MLFWCTMDEWICSGNGQWTLFVPIYLCFYVCTCVCVCENVCYAHMLLKKSFAKQLFLKLWSFYTDLSSYFFFIISFMLLLDIWHLIPFLDITKVIQTATGFFLNKVTLLMVSLKLVISITIDFRNVDKEQH